MRAKRPDPTEWRDALTVWEAAGTDTVLWDDPRVALGAEENQHSMTTVSTRWSHGPSGTTRNRDAHGQEVSRRPRRSPTRRGTHAVRRAPHVRGSFPQPRLPDAGRDRSATISL